jgi:uncharacterized protein YggE
MRFTIFAGLIGASFLLSTGCAGGGTSRGAAVPVSEAEAIFVTGEGSASASPDRLRLNLGVEAKAETLDAALRDNSARMTALRDALIKLGVTKQDLKTGQFSISQVREPVVISVASPPVPNSKAQEASPQMKVGVAPASSETQVMHHEERWIERYVVSNTLEVCYSELARAGELITAAVAAGANNSWGLTFEVTDEKPLEKKAREAALVDAQERALQIAKTTGVKLGRVLSVTDGSGGDVVPSYGPMMKMAAMDSMPIEGGQTELRLSVRVAYSIER